MPDDDNDRVNIGVAASVEEEGPRVEIFWQPPNETQRSLSMHPALAARLGRSLLAAVEAVRAMGYEVDEEVIDMKPVAPTN